MGWGPDVFRLFVVTTLIAFTLKATTSKHSSPLEKSHELPHVKAFTTNPDYITRSVTNPVMQGLILLRVEGTPGDSKVSHSSNRHRIARRVPTLRHITGFIKDATCIPRLIEKGRGEGIGIAFRDVAISATDRLSFAFPDTSASS